MPKLGISGRYEIRAQAKDVIVPDDLPLAPTAPDDTLDWDD